MVAAQISTVGELKLGNDAVCSYMMLEKPENLIIAKTN
jgi:hypothetical protein